MSVGDALRGHVEKTLANSVAKYFDNAIEASVVFSREGNGGQLRSDISVHVGRNIQMQGHAEAGGGDEEETVTEGDRPVVIAEMTAPIETLTVGEAVMRMDLEQYPTKLATPCATLLCPAQNARGAGDSIRSDTALANMDALVFHNRAHSGINVVFRRSDGHIGWIDPQGNPPANAHS